MIEGRLLPGGSCCRYALIKLACRHAKLFPPKALIILWKQARLYGHAVSNAHITANHKLEEFVENSSPATTVCLFQQKEFRSIKLFDTTECDKFDLIT
jgi:hypothetical protein